MELEKTIDNKYYGAKHAVISKHHMSEIANGLTNDKIMLIDLEGNFFKQPDKTYKIVLKELSFIIFTGTTIHYKYSTIVKHNGKMNLTNREAQSIGMCVKRFNGLSAKICGQHGVYTRDAYNEFYRAQHECKYIFVKGRDFEQAFINEVASINDLFMNVQLNKNIINLEDFGVVKIDRCTTCTDHSGCGKHIDRNKHHCSMSDVMCFYNQLINLHANKG